MFVALMLLGLKSVKFAVLIYFREQWEYFSRQAEPHNLILPTFKRAFDFL